MNLDIAAASCGLVARQRALAALQAVDLYAGSSHVCVSYVCAGRRRRGSLQQRRSLRPV